MTEPLPLQRDDSDLSTMCQVMMMMVMREVVTCGDCCCDWRVVKAENSGSCLPAVTIVMIRGVMRIHGGGEMVSGE